MAVTESIAIKWNADLYDGTHNFVSQYGEDLVSILNPQPGEAVLDLGCGSGGLAARIYASGAQVKGIDSSVDMIDKASRSFPAVDFEVASAIDYEAFEQYDAIFSNAALHWILEKEKVVNQCFKNLKKGGRFVLEMGGKGNVASIVSTLKDVLIKHGYTENARIEQWYFPSLSEYTTILESAGFRVQFATHFDRETELHDDKSGIKDWLKMFAVGYLRGIKNPDELLDEVQNLLKPTRFRDGKWYADYKRLRVIATKPNN